MIIEGRCRWDPKEVVQVAGASSLPLISGPLVFTTRETPHDVRSEEPATDFQVMGEEMWVVLEPCPRCVGAEYDHLLLPEPSIVGSVDTTRPIAYQPHQMSQIHATIRASKSGLTSVSSSIYSSQTGVYPST